MSISQQYRSIQAKRNLKNASKGPNCTFQNLRGPGLGTSDYFGLQTDLLSTWLLAEPLEAAHNPGHCGHRGGVLGLALFVLNGPK